jgi:hypothetical protein
MTLAKAIARNERRRCGKIHSTPLMTAIKALNFPETNRNIGQKLTIRKTVQIPPVSIVFCFRQPHPSKQPKPTKMGDISCLERSAMMKKQGDLWAELASVIMGKE